MACEDPSIESVHLSGLSTVRPQARFVWPTCLLIIAITLVAYIPAIRTTFIWDDDKYVTENKAVTQTDGLPRIWSQLRATPQYYPMVFTTFWLEYRLWQDNPLGYHLVNVLLHAANACLLWILLRKLRIPGALFAAAVFALHPVHVESVAWITERKNVLSGIFYFFALLTYLRFDDRLDSNPKSAWRAYAVSLLFFACALFSKTVTCSLPVAILLILWWRRREVRSIDLKRLIPMFAIGLVLSLITIYLEKKHVGAEGQDWHLSPIDRCLVAGRAIWFYLGKLLWPHPLIFIYPRWQIDAKEFVQYLYPTAAIAVLLILWRSRRRIGTGPICAAAFFIATLSPALGFIDVYPMRFSFVADHFQYLASIGPIVLISALLARWSTSRLAFAPATLVIVLLGYLTWHQGPLYQDKETLWRKTIAANPTAWIAHNNLGWTLEPQGKLEEAEHLYREALRLKPDVVEPNNNLANVLVKLGRTTEALPYYLEALKLNPNVAATYFNLGRALGLLNRDNEAVQNFNTALRINPDFFEARFNLGVALSKMGRVQSAIDQFRQVTKQEPDMADAHFNLADLLARTNELPAAIEHYELALRLKPDDKEAALRLELARKKLARGQTPLTELAASAKDSSDPKLIFEYAQRLEEPGRLDEALKQYKKVLRLKPNDVHARSSMAGIYAKQGQTDRAIMQYQEVLRLDPNFVDAGYNLATVLLQADRPKEALTLLQQVVRKTPDSAEAHNNLASALVANNQPVEAIEHLRQAIALKPGHLEARFNLASLLGGQGQTREAIEQFHELLKLNPKDQEARQALAVLENSIRPPNVTINGKSPTSR
jgi:tetratricopeptide (TPR) repeat protein